MILIASCTEDTAEVDDLVRGEEYVTVRMQVPGMKNATTRADEAEDKLTSVWALVFRDRKLVSKTEVTTSTLIPSTSTTGTFNLSRPKVNDVIHFLGNVPSGVTLPDVEAAESALCNLETGDRENLSYWGKATYNGGDITVNLYRHLAKIEIAPDPNECTFPEDELFIAGLVNANTKGKLVPYDDENGAFNFDLRDENYGGNYDYCTVPAEPNPLEETPLLDNNGAGFKNWLYVFEHENPETADGLYVICKIGKYYYKVALIDDTTGQPYDIVRNHRYVIYVNDLEEGVSTYELALKADPVNFEVVEMKDVTLTLTPKASTLYYNSTSEEAVTVTVGDIDSAVETLTFTAPGFTILSDYATDEGNGVFSITDRTKEAINFTLTLTDPNQTNAGTVSVTADGEYVNLSNNPSTTIQLSERAANSGETIMWQGAVEMHNNTADGTTHAGKVLIPYSFFFDANGTQKIPTDSKISLEYNGTGHIQTYLFIDNEPSIWDISDDGTELTLTQELLNRIKQSHTNAWGVDAAFVFEGGEGAVLNKVTLIPARESIDAEPDKTQLYYDSDDTQVVTVNVTVPDGVETLTIGGAEYFAIAKTAGNGTLNGTGTTYTMGSERTATFTFTLNAQNVTSQQTITFSDPSETVNSASVIITMAQTPKVTFTNTGAQTLYWNNGSPTNFQVPMNGVPNDKSVTLSITGAEAFTITDANSNELQLDGDNYTYTGGNTTFTIKPKDANSVSDDDYTIGFSGTGDGVNVVPAEVIVTVKASNSALFATSDTINMDNRETYTTITLTKPTNVQNIKVTFDANTFIINDNQGDTNNDYWINNNSNSTIDIKFTIRNNNVAAGDYTVTFVTGDNQMSATATITIKKTPTVSFSDTSDKILYWNDGNPTSFDVGMTGVPNDGIVTLSINAAAFTVTESSGTLSGPSNGVYTYTGGNTTFTITPASAESVNANAHTISITGTGEGVIVPETPIKVTVGETAPGEIVIWEGTETINYHPGFTLSYDKLKDYLGDEMCVDVLVADHSNYKQIQFKKDGADYQLFNSNSITMPQNEVITLRIIIPKDLTTAITIFGDGLTLKKFYIE